MRSDIVPGAIFPDYELSDHTAKRRKLSERALMRDEMLDDITLYWLTGGSRRRTSLWPGRPSSVERLVRSPERPVGTRHVEKTMTTCELDMASIRDRALLDCSWKEAGKDL